MKFFCVPFHDVNEWLLFPIIVSENAHFFLYFLPYLLLKWPVIRGLGYPVSQVSHSFDIFNVNNQSNDWIDRFQYMAVADNRQRVMPLPDDRLSGRCQTLAYPEAVLLTNPKNPALKGEVLLDYYSLCWEWTGWLILNQHFQLQHGFDRIHLHLIWSFFVQVDDKYQYSCENNNLKVHGWISTNPPTGFWQITPSDEFRSGGPLKQSLTSHVGPTTLAVGDRTLLIIISSFFRVFHIELLYIRVILCDK